MVIAGAMIISFYSCKKDDSLPIQSTGTPSVSSADPITINLTTENWEAKGNGVFVNIFSNIMSLKANQSVNVYLNGKEIHERVLFMDGVVWASNTQTDVAITYFGKLQTAPRLTITVVIE
jgi:hypothetical protein